MDKAHLHLLITHLPIYGSILGTIVLVYGMFTRSRATIQAAYILFIISAIGGAVAYLTGESAEETAEKLAGISKKTIHEHEESAEMALFSIIALGFLSLAGLLSFRSKKFMRPIAVLMLIVSLVCFGLTARTGYLGGQIRHTEIVANN